MVEQHLFYIVLLMVACSLSALTAFHIWKRRTTPGAYPLLLYALGLCIWALTYGLYWASESPANQLFWLNMTYLGVVIAPGALFAFTLYQSGRSALLKGRRALLLGVEPAITLLLLWTDPWHGLFFAGKQSAESSTIFDGGPWFWINVLYSYGLILIATALLLQALLRSTRIFRNQAGLILFAATIPTISNAISLMGLNPLHGLDLTPLSFTLTGLIFTYGLDRTKLLDLVPVARFQVVDQMSVGLLVIDQHHRIVDSNPAALALLRRMNALQSEQLIGAPVFTVLPDWESWISREASIHIISEVTAHTADAPTVRVAISPLLDAQSRCRGQVVTLTDVTEQKRAQQREFELALERERVSVLSHFIRDASHEFRTPLSIIRTSMYLLTRTDDAGRRGEKAAQIEHSINGMTRLVDMLVKLATLDSGLPLNREFVDVNLLVNQAATTPRPGQKTLHWEFNLSPCVMGAIDSDQLLEALCQLFDNAVRFTPEGGTISVNTYQLDDQLSVEIRDTGCGIAGADLPKIFNRFFRLDDAHTSPGFGLGLPIAKRIVEMHGGSISVTSQVGQGSTFRIILPIGKPEQRDEGVYIEQLAAD